MKIWVTRHGQTDLNQKRLMQGRTDEPLNKTGIAQAQAARAAIGDVSFDAVYSSSLDRAVATASIIGNVPRESIHIDDRIIETDFGKYECVPYDHMGIPMTLYWSLPELFPAPRTVETIASMTARSASFLREIETMPYENVLVVCHGGIIRALCGYLEDKKNGIRWRPRPLNCEIRVYHSESGKHAFLRKYEIADS